MSLDVPNLDDRRFEDILEDARKRLPVHGQEWTDHNAHDPGITILELLAWLAESYGYEIDQITEAHRRKYLQLLDATPREPRRATGQLRLGDVSPHDGRKLPAGTPLAAEPSRGELVRFETTDPVYLTGAQVADVVSEHPSGRTDHTRENEGQGRHYRAFGREAGPECALYLGLDADPFAGEFLDLVVDFHDEDLPTAASHGAEASPFEPSIGVTWQYCSEPSDWYRASGWTDLEVEVDETEQFYRGGRVRLARPEAWPPGEGEAAEPVRILDREPPRFWLRAIARARATADERYEVPPQFDAVRTNVVTVSHRESVEAVQLYPPDGTVTTASPDGERTTGEPDQRFAFDRAPARAASVRVGGAAWTEVEDLDASGPSDRHYVLDPAAGEVRFGDGRRGAIPDPGQDVVAESVVYGGGPGGNVGSDVTWHVTSSEFPSLEATPLGSIQGGREAESVDEAMARAIEARRTPARAVTAADYRTIATNTPGLRFGRAAALVDDDGGPVRVVVVPYAPRHVERPTPTSGFLDAVEAHLRRHLLLTDRVAVVRPEYVPVDVTAEVHLTPGVDRGAELRGAEADLAAFLHPLQGFEGDGWPFERPVYDSELYEVLEARTGIDSVRNVNVESGGEPDLGQTPAALPYPEAVSVEARRGATNRCRGDR